MNILLYTIKLSNYYVLANRGTMDTPQFRISDEYMRFIEIKKEVINYVG